MSDEVKFLLLLAVVLGLFALVMGTISNSNQKERNLRDEAEKQRRDQAENDRIRKIKDHQLNHGRRVFNWLTDQSFPSCISIWKIENNGGKYSIFVELRLESGSHYPILQLSYDFDSKFHRECEGHVHYGSYGGDAYFPVLEHTSFDYGLEDIVLKYIRWEVSDYQSRLAARVQ